MIEGCCLSNNNKAATALLVDDVLHLTIFGALTERVLQDAISYAALTFASVDDDCCGAIVFDMSAVQTHEITNAQLAHAWRRQVPACPAAIVYRGDPGAFWHGLLLRLASHPAHPAPLLAFPEHDRSQAIAWARARAATFRAEQARRRP